MVFSDERRRASLKPDERCSLTACVDAYQRQARTNRAHHSHRAPRRIWKMINLLKSQQYVFDYYRKTSSLHPKRTHKYARSVICIVQERYACIDGAIHNERMKMYFWFYYYIFICSARMHARDNPGLNCMCQIGDEALTMDARFQCKRDLTRIGTGAAEHTLSMLRFRMISRQSAHPAIEC